MTDYRESTRKNISSPDIGTILVQARGSSVGFTLTEARKIAGWSIEDVAHRLKLLPRQIAAIEADNYAVLPEMVMVRGYIRAYAKLLNVDLSPWTPLLLPVSPATPTTSETLSSPLGESHANENKQDPQLNQRKPTSSFRTLGIWLGSAFLFLLAIASLTQWIIWQQQTKPSQMTTMPLPHPPRKQVIHPNMVGPSENKLNQEPPESMAFPPNEKDLHELTHEKTVITGKTNHTHSNASSDTNMATLLASHIFPQKNQKAPFALHTTEDSWIEVRHVNDHHTRLFSGVMKAGETQTFELSQPLAVVVGKVDGTQATVNGQPFDLKQKTHKHSKVARFIVQ